MLLSNHPLPGFILNAKDTAVSAEVLLESFHSSEGQNIPRSDSKLSFFPKIQAGKLGRQALQAEEMK